MALLKAVQEVQEEDPCLQWPTLADWLTQVKAEPIWLCKTLVPEGGLTYVTGHSKRCNKTFFTDLLTLCVASGQQHDIIIPSRSAKVISVQEEGIAQANKGRFECYMRDYGFPEDCLNNIIYSYCSGVDVLDKKWQDSLIALVQREQPGLMIWDPLTFIHSGDEGKAHEMQPVVKFARRIAALGCAIIIVAHLNKGEGEDADRDIDTQMRGSSVFINSYDSHIAFRKYKQASEEDPSELTIRSKVFGQQDLLAFWEIEDSGKNDGSINIAKFWTADRDSDEAMMATISDEWIDRAQNLDYDVQYTLTALTDLWGCKANEVKENVKKLTDLGFLEKQGKKWSRQ